MKRLLLLFALALMVATPSWAGRNANGMMLVHTDDAIVYTATADYCQSATPDACVDFVNTSHKTLDEVTVVWLMAAFVASSSPGVTTLQFGIHHNLPPNAGYFERYSACGPQPLELPDAGWPEPNDCGNLVAYSVPVYDHAFPFYWFAIWHDDDSAFFGTKTYPTTNEAKFVDDGSPPIEDLCFAFATMRWNVPGEMHCFPDFHFGACCYPDGSCIQSTPADCQGIYYGDGMPCVPNPCPQTGACCLPDGSCIQTTQAECQGVYYGDGVSCEPNPCPPVGACCFQDGQCFVLTELECLTNGGSFFPDMPCTPDFCDSNARGACCLDDGSCEIVYYWDCSGTYQGDYTSCYPGRCPPAGACCLDMEGNCVILIQAACEEQGGEYKGDGSTCVPDNPCYGFPTKSTTWGQIKATFR